jgi:thioredoxin-like negative regulator of GroEL
MYTVSIAVEDWDALHARIRELEAALAKATAERDDLERALDAETATAAEALRLATQYQAERDEAVGLLMDGPAQGWAERRDAFLVRVGARP